MQVKAAIFQQMKNDYERISTFKANQGIKQCTAVIIAWREQVCKKIIQKEKQEDFLQCVVVQRYSKLLNDWQKFSSYRQTIKKREEALSEKRALMRKCAAFDELYEHCQESKKLKRHMARAQEYERQSLITRSFVALYHFKNYAEQQRESFEAQRQLLNEKKLRRVIVQMRRIADQRQGCRQIEKSLTEKRLNNEKRDIFFAWLDEAF